MADLLLVFKGKRCHFRLIPTLKSLRLRHVMLILDQFVEAYKTRHPKPVVNTEVPQPDGRRGD